MLMIKFFLKLCRSSAIFVIYLFFSKLTIFSIYISKIKKQNILYTNHFGFGDFLFFCVHIRKKISTDTKIFCYSELQYEVAHFFFDKKYIQRSLWLMPKYMSEGHLGYRFLFKSKIFRPIEPKRIAPNNTRVLISDFYSGNKESVKFIKEKINNNKISDRIRIVFKKPTISIFVKNFSLNSNNNMNFQVRQTRDLNKIERLLVFLNQKKINVIILGTVRDHFVQLFEKKIKIKKMKNIYFFKNLSDNFSIADQAYVAFNSIGYLGSASGAMGFFGMLNKKVILLDPVFYQADKYWKNFIFLYKKLYNKKKKSFQKFYWKKYYAPTIYKIVETNYSEIKQALLKNILKKF